jgi:hypothetical protein
MPATVYSFDPHTREYVGTTLADDDPEEEGALLFPAFTTQDPPPEIPSGMTAYWVGDEWELRSNTEGGV